MDAVNVNFLGMSVAVSLSRFLISSYWYTSATLQVYMFKSCRLLATLLKVLHSYCCSAAVQIFHTFAIIIYYQYLQSLCEMWETLCMLYHSLSCSWPQINVTKGHHRPRVCTLRTLDAGKFSERHYWYWKYLHLSKQKISRARGSDSIHFK